MLSGSAQLSVLPGKTATELAQKLTGGGVEVSSPTLSCKNYANGFFNVVSSNLGLDSGIILTNGRAATQLPLIGVNGPSGYFASTNNLGPGDAMLTALAGKKTFDACILEFDVVPLGDTISFDYVFSSEEYISAVCGSYNDVFGFFISGPGISGSENIALVPGTTVPVAINSVNDGIPGSSGSLAPCNAMGPGSPFTAYYVDNASGGTITHQGFTRVLTALHSVQPCEKYHLKLAIADAGNEIYDSGVFLKAGSLSSGQCKVSAVSPAGKDTTVAFCVRGCAPGLFVVRRTSPTSFAQVVRLLRSGSAVSGADYSPLPDSVVIPAGASSVTVTVNALPGPPAATTKQLKLAIVPVLPCTGAAYKADSAAIIIYDTVHLAVFPADTIICGNDHVQLQVSGDDFYTYRWSPGDYLDNPDAQNPLASPPLSIAYTVTATLPGSSCLPHTAVARLNVKLTPYPQLPQTLTACMGRAVKLQAVMSSPNDYYSYQWQGPAGFSSSALSPVIDSVTPGATGLYTITATIDTNGCSTQAGLSLHITDIAPPVTEQNLKLCQGRTGMPLSASGRQLLWYIPPFDSTVTSPPTPGTRETGTYIYKVTQTDQGCESIPTLIQVDVLHCCEGQIAVPSAFTPNNDGLNDRLHVIRSFGFDIESFHIYNRWGQVVYAGLNGDWDGYYNGVPAGTGTYYYLLSVICETGGHQVLQGDITLIR